MIRLFLVLFCFGFYCDNNNVVMDAEGNPHIDADATDSDKKASSLEDKVNPDEKKSENKDGIVNNTLKSKNADVLR